jgi:hypothetical protein
MVIDPLPPPHPAPRPPPRRPDPVALVWIGGIALAALAYVLGPDHVVASVLAAIDRAGWAVSELIGNLTAAAFEAMRAAAIGLLGVFVALSVLAIRRDRRGHAGLIVLTVVFILLVWGANGDTPAANTRWLLALALAALGAVAATNRLARAPGGWRVPRPGQGPR